ncbi:Tyrosine-protein phosphatase YVH1 [Diplonema papillatum]|nr:Tyrosine-protein phosphatase YVH1 [Diplonema papillatum]|eukprot:gene23033-35295_t
MRIHVRIPNVSSRSLVIRAKGAISVEGVLQECQRKLGVNVPVSLYNSEHDDAEKISDEWTLQEADELFLVPIFPKGTAVRAARLANHPELNGREGVICGQKQGKYVVSFDGKKGMMAGVNLEAVDDKADRAAEAFRNLMAIAEHVEEDGSRGVQPDGEALTADEEHAMHPDDEARSGKAPDIDEMTRSGTKPVAEAGPSGVTPPASEAAPGPKCNGARAAGGARREQQKRLCAELLAKHPHVGVRLCATFLKKHDWDAEAAARALGEYCHTAAAAAAAPPSGDELTTEVASGGTDDPSLRRIAKDTSIGAPDVRHGESASEGDADFEVQFACRKCREPLCSSADLKPHDDNSKGKAFKKKHGTDRISFQACTSVFVAEGAVPWIEEALARETEMKGDVKCPNAKCGSKVGTFAWTGHQCCCGVWVNPAIQLQHAKMDRFARQSEGYMAR